MKKIVILISLIASFSVQAAIFEGPENVGQKCSFSESAYADSAFSCAMKMVINLTLLPSLIVAADGRSQMNPELIKAINSVLNSQGATPEQKAEAQEALNRMVNSLSEQP